MKPDTTERELSLRERDLIELGWWSRHNSKYLRMALYLAEVWEVTGAEAELGDTAIYKPTADQMKRSNGMKRCAKRYAELREQLKLFSQREGEG